MAGQGDEPKGSRESLVWKIGKYAAIGLEFPSTVIGGLFLGYFLDGYFGTFPWLMTVCSLAALVGAFVRLVQWLRRFSDREL
jgi:F0F1-type ATP synthase assembly protein I